MKAYKGLKDFEKVAALRESIISIIDGINSKDKQNAALELNAIHKADEQEEYIAEQTLQLRIRNISLAFLGCVTCLILFVLWRIWRHTIIVKYKNKMLAKFINEKLAGKVENKQLFIDGDAEDPIAVPLDLEPETGFSEKDDLSPDEVVESREEEDENKNLEKYATTGSPEYDKMVSIIAERFGLSSLKFNTLETLIEAIGLPKCKVCTHCFDGSSHF